MVLSFPEHFPEITGPTLMIHRQKVANNLQQILAKTDAQQVGFRPHMKTHQHPQVGEWMKQAGVSRITVSSVEMARQHADWGWTDITIAIPVNIRMLREIQHLSMDVDLHVVVDHTDPVHALGQHKIHTGVWIEVDTGSGRTGIPGNEIEQIQAVIHAIDHYPTLSCRGLLWHDGHQYGVRELNHIESTWQQSVQMAEQIRNAMGDRGQYLALSAGDTPSATQIDDLSQVDEVRPGNLIYYDLMQWQAGVCHLEQIAICIAAPVIGQYMDRCEIAVHAGAVHLSKESLLLSNGETIYGIPVHLRPDGWAPLSPNARVHRISQEHGLIKLSKEEMSAYSIGSLIGILPVHSCLTADVMKQQSHYII